MDNELISIIIPVYNAEPYLDTCLKSIVEQTFDSYEVILVDDGSTDGSPSICDTYSKADSRFKVVHKKNGGVSSARNVGINLSKGEYLMFIDSDDELLPDSLEVLADVVASEDIVIGGYTTFVNGIPTRKILPLNDRTYREEEMLNFFEDNIRRNCELLDAPWAKMFRRRTVGSLRFCEDLSYAEDKLFVFNFLNLCTSAYTCSRPIYAYRIRHGSLGSDVKSDRHLMQLRHFIPQYSNAIDRLVQHYPMSVKLNSLYHKDVVGRYLCRILNIFLTRRTYLLTEDYITWVYCMMSKDMSLSLFSVRLGQVFNILLYKIGSIGLTVNVYRIVSKIKSLFHA